jgi:hypothetical protein
VIVKILTSFSNVSLFKKSKKFLGPSDESYSLAAEKFANHLKK